MLFFHIYNFKIFKEITFYLFSPHYLMDFSKYRSIVELLVQICIYAIKLNFLIYSHIQINYSCIDIYTSNVIETPNYIG